MEYKGEKMVTKKRFSKPVIGVTGPDKGGFPSWFFTRLLIRLMGGKAVRIKPSKPKWHKKLDGLIIGGGADVNPSLYGAEKEELIPEFEEHKRSLKGLILYLVALIFFPLLYLLRKLFSSNQKTLSDQARDQLELEWLDRAVKDRLPILGICRGAQLINVYFGGTLHQHLAGFYTETPQMWTILPKKKIQIEPTSRLAQILQTTECKVNALHHQAVRELGNDLVTVATESNRIIQAIEHQNHSLIIGVQWHPEFLPQIWRQRLLFKALIHSKDPQSGVINK